MNPLLKDTFGTPFETIPFPEIQNGHYLPALKEAIAEGLQQVETITNNAAPPTFENTIEALEQSGKKLNRVASVFFNLLNAETNEEMQKLALEISPMLSEYQNDVLLNTPLFERIAHVWEHRSALSLSAEEERLLEKTYKQFARNGAALNDEQKQQLREIGKELSQATITFGENVLKETNAFLMEITNEADLEGLPASAIEAAKMTAKQKDKPNSWVFTLQYPSYMPFMTYSKNRVLREKLYRAFAARCFQGNEFDNQAIIRKIVQLRHRRAVLLGYASHADFVLEERMAESSQKVNDFLEELLAYGKPAAERELAELRDFAKELDGLETLQRWDYAYYAEKLKMKKFNIDDELLKPYFQLEKVIEGVFGVANRLYGLQFAQRDDIPTYHEEVIPYEVTDADNNFIGVFYADFFPREGKKNGAWMTYFQGQHVVADTEFRPQVSIVCNFTRPTETLPALLTFNEVTTLFHEFGHALHCLLAKGKYSSLTGTNVYWDFVELPSQLLENWAYEKECLDTFARHYETGEPIPAEWIENIKTSANYMGGYQTVRQVSFARLDMAWHQQNPEANVDIHSFEEKAMKPTELFPEVEGACMSTSFSHIFQGGYSAGYYSYKWAEVLDADAFEYFKEHGIFSKEIGEKFRKHVLSAGGSEHPMELYKRFRGKEPSPQALLKRTGLVEA